MNIQENTFAAACYNDNTIAQLEKALAGRANKFDMKAWGLNPIQWREQIKMALAALRADAAEHE